MHKILTVKEVAKIINLSEFTIRKKARDGEIKGFFHVGGYWRISEENLNKWIKELEKRQSKK